VISETAYDEHVEQLFDVLARVASALREAGIEYRLVGGLAIFLHFSERDPMAARLTRDIDMAVDRSDLSRIAEAVEPFGFKYRHTARLDMLVDARNPKARSAVHLLFVREKVRSQDLAAIPDFSPAVTARAGTLLAPVADLVRMKLTSFRLKDKVHIQDLDGVGLITPQIEAGLPGELLARLVEVRETR
jgi:hypothetical protein